MASIVIVADQCYLLAEAINYIVIHEIDDTGDCDWQPSTVKQRKLRKRNPNKYAREYALERKPYNIVIDFIPKNGPQIGSGSGNNSLLKKGSDDNTFVSIRVHGFTRTMALFKDIVSQLRDQIPDELYLDRLVEKFLTSEAEEK